MSALPAAEPAAAVPGTPLSPLLPLPRHAGAASQRLFAETEESPPPPFRRWLTRPRPLPFQDRGPQGQGPPAAPHLSRAVRARWAGGRPASTRQNHVLASENSSVGSAPSAAGTELILSSCGPWVVRMAHVLSHVQLVHLAETSVVVCRGPSYCAGKRSCTLAGKRCVRWRKLLLPGNNGHS